MQNTNQNDIDKWAMMATLTGSSIVKVVREAAIVVEAVVGVLGGRQGSSAQGEKQNSLMTDYTTSCVRQYFGL